MERTVKLKIPFDQRFVDTIETYNKSCNYCLSVGFKKNTFNKNELHKLTYAKVRKKYPNLQSSLVCASRDQASDMLKREKLKRLPTKKKHSAIRYNLRTFTPKLEDGRISISTIFGRLKVDITIPNYFKRYIGWEIKSCALFFKNGGLYVHLIAHSETPDKVDSDKFVGIDRGIINPVVTSDNKFFNSKHIRSIKGKYQWLKSKLQSKGTRSAKRRLKKISGRERRFITDVNHCISKEIVESDFDTFVLEKLNIRRRKKQGKRFNKLLGMWSFGQFQQFLEYKAETNGKNVVYINPKHTSQKCSVCGHIEKSNRKGVWFECKKCGFRLNSDLNASRNIVQLGKASLNRLSVNQPIVTSST